MALATSLWVGCAKNSGNNGGSGGSGTNASINDAAVVCANIANSRGFDMYGITTACAQVGSGQCPTLDQYYTDYLNGTGRYERNYVPGLDQAGNCMNALDEQGCFMQELTTVNTFWASFVQRSYLCSPQDRNAIVTELRNRINGLNSQTYRPAGYGTGAPGYGGSFYGNPGYGVNGNRGYPYAL